MSQSPLSNLSKEEYAARHRLLRLILGVLGVLVVVLLIVQFRAALIGTAAVLGTTVEDGQELIGELTEDDAIGTIGEDLDEINDAAKGGFITILLQEAVIDRVADKVNNSPVVEPVEEAPEDGAADTEPADLPEGDTPTPPSSAEASDTSPPAGEEDTGGTDDSIETGTE